MFKYIILSVDTIVTTIITVHVLFELIKRWIRFLILARDHCYMVLDPN